MGKFMYAVLMVFFIEFSLWLFAGVDYVTTSLFGILFNPTTMSSNALYVLIIVTLGAFAASVIIPGNFYQINIYALYAGIAVVFFSFVFSIVHLFSFVYGQLESVALGLALPITILITAPLFIYYMMATVEWVRSNQ